MFTLKDFSFWYSESTTAALKDINITFSPGEFVLILGPNGGGKSTLLKSLVNIVPGITPGKTQGEIRYKGKDVGSKKLVEYSADIGIILQNPDRQITNLTLGEESTFGLENLNFSKPEIYRRSQNALQMVGLNYPLDRSVFSLSGGEKQRLIIASLIAMDARVLILDEPTVNLDPWGTKMVIDTLEDLKNSTDLIIISAHVVDPFLKLATRIVVIADGQITMDFPIEKLNQNLDRLGEYSVTLGPKENKKGPETISSGHVLELNHVSFAYKTGPNVLKNVNIILEKGSQSVLLARNGAGKSTLARLMVCLEKPTGGSLHSQAHRNGMIMQNPDQGFIGLSVYEEMKIGNKMSDSEVFRWLERFQLLRYKDTPPFKLSDGERRRLATAVSLSLHPDILVVDETTAGLDAINSIQILNELEKFDGTLVNITHDKRVVARFQNDLIVLSNGEACFQGSLAMMDPNIKSLSGLNL